MRHKPQVRPLGRARRSESGSSALCAPSRDEEGCRSEDPCPSEPGRFCAPAPATTHGRSQRGATEARENSTSRWMRDRRGQASNRDRHRHRHRHRPCCAGSASLPAWIRQTEQYPVRQTLPGRQTLKADGVRVATMVLRLAPDREQPCRLRYCLYPCRTLVHLLLLLNCPSTHMQAPQSAARETPGRISDDARPIKGFTRYILIE